MLSIAPFYQLNYSRSMISIKYRRIRAFTATAISTSLGIQILPLKSDDVIFIWVTQLLSCF